MSRRRAKTSRDGAERLSSTDNAFHADDVAIGPVTQDSLDVEVHEVAAPVAVVKRRDPVGVARFARYLRDRFGEFMPSRKRRPGRERMVQALVERCDLPRRRARAMVNRLEKQGLLRFRRGHRRNGFRIETA